MHVVLSFMQVLWEWVFFKRCPRIRCFVLRLVSECHVPIHSLSNCICFDLLCVWLCCRITEHLGSGVFGTVCQGFWHTKSGTLEVAIKMAQNQVLYTVIDTGRGQCVFRPYV